MSRVLQLVLTVGMLSLLAGVGGCNSSRTVTLDSYPRGAEPMLRRAPETGLYRVQWLSADGRKREVVADSARLVARGAPVGFVPAEGGGVVAVAGGERFPLVNLPGGARYCAWTYKSEKQSRLGRSLATAGDVVRTGAAAAFLVGAGAASAAMTEDGVHELVDEAERQVEHRR